MTEQSRRKELLAQYKQARPDAGVYRIVNTQNGKFLLSSASNLSSMSGKLEFAKTIDSSNVVDQRPSTDASDLATWTWLGGRRGGKDRERQLSQDIREYGIGAFSFEVLEVLETRPEMPQADILRDLSVLEDLWREKFDPSQLY